MVTWWRETNASLLLDLLTSDDGEGGGADFTDQVEWTSAAGLHNDSDLDAAPVGMVHIDHPNFTQVIESVLRRDPNTTFRYFETDAWWRNSSSLDDDDRPFAGACPGTGGATAAELLIVARVGFALDVVAQTAVGACGALANACAAYVLTDSRRLSASVFNCLLACLLAVHTLYIADSLALQVYKSARGSAALDAVFANLLFPAKPMLLYSSTALTVLMARERHSAIRQPIEYRNLSLSGRPWRRAAAHIVACVAVSSAFVVPLFFESEIRWYAVRTAKVYNETHTLEAVDFRHEMRVSEFRTRRAYVFWYKNVATFALTVLLPVLLLAYWNANTVRLMRDRRLTAAASSSPQRTTAAGVPAGSIASATPQRQPSDPRRRRPPSGERLLHPRSGRQISPDNSTSFNFGGGGAGGSGAQAIKSEENTARILLVLTVLFFMCNTLRVIIVTEEVVSNRDYRYAEENGCVAMPFWVLVTNRISQFLLTVNASLAPAVYCAMSRDFRRALADRMRRPIKRLRRLLGLRSSFTFGAAGAAASTSNDDAANAATSNNAAVAVPAGSLNNTPRVATACVSNNVVARAHVSLTPSRSLGFVSLLQQQQPPSLPPGATVTVVAAGSQSCSKTSSSAECLKATASLPLSSEAASKKQHHTEVTAVVEYKIPSLPLRSSSVRRVLFSKQRSSGGGQVSIV